MEDVLLGDAVSVRRRRGDTDGVTDPVRVGASVPVALREVEGVRVPVGEAR